MNLAVDNHYRPLGAIARAKTRAENNINFVAKAARGEKFLAKSDILLIAAREARTAHADRDRRLTHSQLRLPSAKEVRDSSHFVPLKIQRQRQSVATSELLESSP